MDGGKSCVLVLASIFEHEEPKMGYLPYINEKSDEEYGGFEDVASGCCPPHEHRDGTRERAGHDGKGGDAL